MNLVKDKIKQFWKDEDGVGTLELLMIIAVIVIIAIAFRKWIMKWLEELFSKADAGVSDQLKNDFSPVPAASLTPKSS
jgi:Flp pilus assembly pilin Flp